METSSHISEIKENSVSINTEEKQTLKLVIVKKDLNEVKQKPVECSKIRVPFCGKIGAGKYFIVSKCDEELVSKYRWNLSQDGYVVANKIGKLHRFIQSQKESLDEKEPVDHINRNRLDNSRENLRMS